MRKLIVVRCNAALDSLGVLVASRIAMNIVTRLILPIVLGLLLALLVRWLLLAWLAG
jgi:hypothetical protein